MKNQSELTMNRKILDSEALVLKSRELQKQGKIIVLCHGTFDLLHTGHIRYLQRARKDGDVLFVTVTADQFVNKGPGRPVFSQDLRAENLAALECVDFVAINSSFTAVDIITKVKPQIYTKGSDYKNLSDDVTGNIHLEKVATESYGGKMLFTDEITFSSSALLNEHFGALSEEAKDYLRKLNMQVSDKDIFKMIDSLAGLKVLVIGDTIIDEYHYTRQLGQSGKGTHMAVKYDSMERYAGGVIAIANHLSGFIGEVTCATGLGENNSHEEFIVSVLGKNVNPVFFYSDDCETLVKKRYVDQDLSKLFEVYLGNDDPLSSKMNDQVEDWLEKTIEGFDLVIAPDFGHGFISDETIKILCGKARFLAVNTQVNSGNRGYHAITKYPRADFVSLNVGEIRLAMHNKYSPLQELVSQLAKKTKAQNIAVTLGSKGSMVYNDLENKFYNAPILSSKVIDRVGAGDAFFGFLSICIAGGLSSEISNFIGGAAAALDVQIVCNKEPIQKSDLFKFITTIMK